MGSVDFWGMAQHAPQTDEQGSRGGPSRQSALLGEQHTYRLEYVGHRKAPHLFTEDDDDAAIAYVAGMLMLSLPLSLASFTRAGCTCLLYIKGGRHRQVFPRTPALPPH